MRSPPPLFSPLLPPSSPRARAVAVVESEEYTRAMQTPPPHPFPVLSRGTGRIARWWKSPNIGGEHDWTSGRDIIGESGGLVDQLPPRWQFLGMKHPPTNWKRRLATCSRGVKS